MSGTQKTVDTRDVVITRLLKAILELDEKQQRVLLDQAEEMLVGDNRTNIRKPCSITVNYAFNNRAFVNHMRDISQKGLFIETQEDVKKGELISMTFSLPGFDKPLKVKGRITHVTPKGAGVEFMELSLYQAEMIGAIVDRMKTPPSE